MKTTRGRRSGKVAADAALTENFAMTDKQPYEIAISVATRFVDEQSKPADNRYVFAYTITIQNVGGVAAQLLSRHWIITDGNGKVQEVVGDGVVGEQPHMRPGEEFQYTSGAVLETSVGTMRGSYQLVADDGTRFNATIPQFTLSVPRTLH
jgi:ApaG protein